MQVVYDPAQKAHDPTSFLVNGAPRPSPEQPGRADALLAAAKAQGHPVTAPKDYGLGPISAVHTPEYVHFLRHAYERWARIEGASEEIIPNVHPDRRNVGYPKSVVGQAGYHMADTACPVSADTWGSITMSANTAVHGARLVKQGVPVAYSLCRPPGHHAFSDLAGGFCFFNNSGIAAQDLRGVADRVAILDVDLHHGNGTQGMFYQRPDVLTVSIHADPIRFYPFFWGHGDERGEGPGLGYNLNLPLPRGSGDDAFLDALKKAKARIEAFAPEVLVVALGLDAYEGDPFGGLTVTTPGFARIAESVAALKLPTLLVQEGGYLCDDLGRNLASFLGAFEGAHVPAWTLG
jgi:acetoin utilization deacetylase AcuC-like enzyme